MPVRPFNSDNEELNKLTDWMLRNFEKKDRNRQIVGREMLNIGTIPERDMEERELRIRDNQGTTELLTKVGTELKVLEFDNMTQDYYLEVKKGNVEGHSIVHKFGYNSGVTTSYAPIAIGGIYQTPTSAVSLEFISSDTADALDDVGMHELTVVGLDASWNEQTVVTSAHATDGLTAVSISGTWLRVYRAYVSLSGTYATSAGGSHQGDITIRVASAGATYATIPSTGFSNGQTEIGAYTIPTGYTGYILSAHANVDSNKVGTLLMFRRDNADDVSSSYSGVMRVLNRSGGVVGSSDLNPKAPINGLVGPCDVGFMGKVSATTGEIDVDFEILLVKN